MSTKSGEDPGLALLRQAGARPVAFDRTIAELRNILAVYEDRLGTTAGRLSLYPTALTHHVFTARLSPADIRVISSTLETRVARIGIRICETPAHEAPFTLDETALAECLADVSRPDTDNPRVRHDVDCVAGVLTLRRGRSATSVERSIAIFCTTSGRVVQNVQQWFFKQGENGIPPIIHQAALTSIAWLKKPAAAPGVKMHELAALCGAAMRPTRATMTKFVETLRRLRTEGSITDDETAAVVASELMEPLLARLDDEFEPDSDSIQEAVERVRATYRHEAVVAADEAVSKAQADMATAHKTAEEAVRTARMEAALAQLSAADAIATRNHILAQMEERISRRARRISNGLFWTGVVIVILAASLSYPGVFDAVGGTAKLIARVILVAAGALGVYSAVNGTSLKDMRRWLHELVAGRIRSRWIPTDEIRDTAGDRRLLGGPRR